MSEVEVSQFTSTPNKLSLVTLGDMHGKKTPTTKGNTVFRQKLQAQICMDAQEEEHAQTGNRVTCKNVQLPRQQFYFSPALLKPPLSRK